MGFLRAELNGLLAQFPEKKERLLDIFSDCSTRIDVKLFPFASSDETKTKLDEIVEFEDIDYINDVLDEMRSDPDLHDI